MRLNFRGKELFVVILSLSNVSMAVTSISPLACPKQFTGSVERIVESTAPFSTRFKKVQVHLKVEEVQKGNVTQNEVFEVLKHVASPPRIGEKVQVWMRGNYLCKLQKDS